MRLKLPQKPALFLVFVVILVALFGFLVVLSIMGSPLFTLATGTSEQKTVIIDPGHGGPDGGAVGVDGVVEKGINLSISLKLRSFFRAAGYRVIMTRQDDRAIYDKGSDTIREMKSTDLHNRLKIINTNPKALFISIHQNIYQEPQYSGTQVFYSANNPEGKLLAQCIQSDVHAMLQPENTREIKPAQKNLFILYYAKSPAVMVECGFLSNPTECKKLEDDSYQNQMAFAIFYGTLHYNSEK